MFTRHDEARRIRIEAAELAVRRPAEQSPNGEERRYRRANGTLSYVACFSKGLPHDSDGLVDGAAYRALLQALEEATPAAFDRVPDGHDGGSRPFLDPLAGLAFDLMGPDPQALALGPAPQLDGAEAAAELAELYWMALLRDVPFAAFRPGNDPVEDAVAQLNSFYAFSGSEPIGPGRVRARLTPETLFRGVLAGDRDGGYVSQFLLAGAGGEAEAERGLVPLGGRLWDQRVRPAPERVDHLTDWAAWLKSRNGAPPAGAARAARRPRFILTPRDLAALVRREAVLPACLAAAEILLRPEAGGALAPGLPRARRLAGDAAYGAAHIRAVLAEAALRARRAASFQKWYVHRRLRPEDMAGLVELNRRIAAGRSAAAPTDLHPQLAACGVLEALGRRRPGARGGERTLLLPQAWPEGAPMSPAYGGATAAVAGACVTVLKAFFDTARVLPFLVEPDPEGRKLVVRPNDAGLTIGGELNKLASNLALGRNLAGVNYFSDYTEGLWLGENIAVGLLREQKLAHNEAYTLSLTPFFGAEPVTI